MKEIRDEILNLNESPLYSYRTEHKYFPVIGEGNHDAKIMFIGEAPGENEAKTARPFCGASGRILDELLASIGLKRLDAYVTNIVKDRPPENRDPTASEIALYAPFLRRQIEIIRPTVIATLGRFSMTYILEMFDCEEASLPISKLHGRLVKVKKDDDLRVASEENNLPVKYILPLYHPAVALYNPNQKKTLLADFQMVKQVL